MEDILQEICQKEAYDINDEWLEKIIVKLEKYYKNNKNRHSYSDVSAFIYKSKISDFEYIVENLTLIKNFCSENNLEELEFKVLKLIDHITLELSREDHIQKIYESKVNELVSKVMKSNLEKFNEDVIKSKKYIESEHEKIRESFNELLKKQKEEVKALNSNLISVLGIFSAVILSFFGGLNILGSVMENIHKVSRYRLAFSIILIMFFVFNVIFVLLYIISRLTEKPISVICQEKKCSECTKKLTYICVKNNFPIVFWYNYICVCLMIIIFIMFITDKYNLITIIIRRLHFTNNGLSLSIMGVIGLAVILKFIFWKTKKFVSKEWSEEDNLKCNNSKNQAEFQVVASELAASNEQKITK
ncbi:hypothetical protein AAGC94_11580 [Clostridium sporogenes]|uniref:hypothetical protein n=1 Tax=Clostridium sporogenes TaxID=1509 RepID=UPI00313E7E79